jgi:hypothetical protein
MIAMKELQEEEEEAVGIEDRPALHPSELRAWAYHAHARLIR